MAKPDSFDFYCEEVLTGNTLVKKVYESGVVLAFHHTKPMYKTHIVIIPKEHIHDLTHLKEKHGLLIQEIIKVARNLARKIDLEKNGVRFVTNLGKFQDSPHLHFHLITGDPINRKK
ncbi:MAG: HIT domain-containing protein [Patescibacteria group bacterium]